MTNNSPWSDPIDPEVLYPISPYNKLLESLNWPDHTQWLNHWLKHGGLNLAASAWPLGTKNDWVWGIGLPFLSDIERFIGEETRILFGISGLPGCGKTSLGRWLEMAAAQLNWPLKVVSMDDFYLTAEALDQAMAGNPWKVPRALPGSHSIELLEETIETWKVNGTLKAPKFDKALRNGLGDRCGWRTSSPKILVLEGWFLGCGLTDHKKKAPENKSMAARPLSLNEKNYQFIVQSALSKYQPLWGKFERVWHLKAIEFISTRQWKTQQEMNLQKERGASLKGESLDLFIRMIEASIPQKDLQSIKSDVIAKLSSSRQIKWIGLSEHNSKKTN